MKKIVICLCSALFLAGWGQQAKAQDPTEIIKEGVKKVIRAVDLQIQRIQTKTIWLQEAQKTLENAMQKLHLDEITDWVQKQKDLYSEYFDELWKVKTFIAYYDRIKEVTARQIDLVNAYKSAWALLKNDKHFTAAELEHMQDVYAGIIDESIRNLDQVVLIIKSFDTQMSDADRLAIINRAADRIEANYTDLNRFNNQNALLSLQRAQDEDDAELVKKMYGLE
ncbi:MAG: conjugal transfer protein TraI [Sphingobacteriales bacterium 50-39]|nr:conjugal transfer protein TraI [Sphingobacteriales bacterium]OJW59360.1 MAG: conjugal transfer protein TraI [Sphingobacteriales bacterium 50-39]